MRACHTAVVVLGVAAVLLSGCSVKDTLDEKLAPEPTTITIEATVAATGAPIDGTLTKGFPDTVPMWPGAKVSKTKTTKTPQGKSYSAVLTTPDPYADVLAGVGAGLETAGWQAEATDASSDEQKVSLIVISNGDADGLVTLSQTQGKPVRLEYVITPK